LAQRVALRPEHLTLAPAGQGIPATVVLAEHLGDVSILYLRVEGVGELLNAKVSAGHQAQCVAGQVVGLAPDASWALAFGTDGRLLTR
jgi:multiple sugar transport system ATP-binding protein